MGPLPTISRVSNSIYTGYKPHLPIDFRPFIASSSPSCTANLPQTNRQTPFSCASKRRDGAKVPNL